MTAPDRDGLVLRSEFAAVHVSRDDGANGPRLRIEDLRGGHSVFLDPLELEWLARSTHTELLGLMPSTTQDSQRRPGEMA